MTSSAAAPVAVAGVVVERRCGLPAGVVDVLRAPETAAAVRAAVAAETEAAGSAAAVADALHRVVPGLDADPATRRAVLAARRDVHNGRLPRLTTAAAATLLPPADAEVFARWREATVRRRDLVAKAEEVAPGEHAVAIRAALALLQHATIAAGLALASPAFTDRLLGTRGAPAWGGRVARSVVSYLSRIARKPSPFSSLTTVGVRPWREAGPAGGAASDRVVTSSRAAALSTLRAAVEAGLAPEVGVVVNPSRRTVGPADLAALPWYGRQYGVLFREDEVTATGPVPEPARGADPLAVATGVHCPRTPWERAAGDHFGAWERTGPGPSALAGPVARLAAAERDLGAMAPRERVRTQQAVDRAVGELFTAADAVRPPWLTSTGLLHETVAHRTTEVDVAADERMLAALTQVGRRLASDVGIAPSYLELVRWGTARLHGGREDLVAFCLALVREAGAFAAAAGAPPSARPDPALLDRVRACATVGAPASAVFWQPAGVPGVDVVVNQVQSGHLGSLARWADLPTLTATIAGAARAWHRERWGEVAVHQFSAHSDWIDFQRPVLAGIATVGWGPELAAGGAPADLAGWTVEADPAGAALLVRDAAGRPAALDYSGAVPPRLLRGVDRVLSLLSDPWVLAAVPEPPAVAVAGGRIRRQERLTHGRVVARRARWTLPAASAPDVDQLGPVGALAAHERFRRAAGLPERVFVRQVPPYGAPGKPQWLDTDAPATVDAVWRGIDRSPGAGDVEITEALPAAVPGVVTEYATLVRHG